MADPTQTLSPEDAEWRALLLAAKDLFQLAPWAWMGDAQHVGVRDPETGETASRTGTGRIELAGREVGEPTTLSANCTTYLVSSSLSV